MSIWGVVAFGPSPTRVCLVYVLCTRQTDRDICELRVGAFQPVWHLVGCLQRQHYRDRLDLKSCQVVKTILGPQVRSARAMLAQALSKPSPLFYRAATELGMGLNNVWTVFMALQTTCAHAQAGGWALGNRLPSACMAIAPTCVGRGRHVRLIQYRTRGYDDVQA